MRKFFAIIFLFIMMLFQSAFADDMYKIKGITFDTSASVAILNTIGTYQSSITDKVKLIKLPDEHKVYFDVTSSILIGKKQDLYLSSGAIKQIKISQFTTNPNIVRIVMFFDDNYNLDNLKIGNINNHLVIMTNELSSTLAQFYQNSYRDKVKTAEDYYETFNIQVQAPNPQPAVLTTANNKYSQKELTQIQQAFGQSNAENIKQLVNSDLSKNINLRSRYYINSVTSKNNGFLIGGFGAPTIQKPFVLANPNRMVFDFVNSNLKNSINNKEILLNPNNLQGDKIRISRLDNNTTRVIVVSEKARQYIPIFSPDNQSVLLVNPENLSANAIVANRTNILKYKYQKNLSTDDLTLSFDRPVVWGIKRNTDNLYVYFFNAAQYNESVFKSAINNTPYHEVELALLKNIGIRLTMPLTSNNDINTYFSADGKNFRIRASGLKPVIKTPKPKETPAIISGGKIRGKVIVLDAGHGGTDYGAIRNGINEKDINLDVAKRVENILRRKGYKVGMTRANDIFVSLEDRCKISASMNPSIFVSIHVNSCVGTEPRGIETHYYHDNSVELATTIHSKMTKAIQSPNRGLFKSKFYVINHTTVPAVLLEIGFISNDKERAELITPKRKQATAQAIAEGIIEYINSHK